MKTKKTIFVLLLYILFLKCYGQDATAKAVGEEKLSKILIKCGEGFFINSQNTIFELRNKGVRTLFTGKPTESDSLNGVEYLGTYVFTYSGPSRAFILNSGGWQPWVEKRFQIEIPVIKNRTGWVTGTKDFSTSLSPITCADRPSNERLIKDIKEAISFFSKKPASNLDGSMGAFDARRILENLLLLAKWLNNTEASTTIANATRAYNANAGYLDKYSNTEQILSQYLTFKGIAIVGPTPSVKITPIYPQDNKFNIQLAVPHVNAPLVFDNTTLPNNGESVTIKNLLRGNTNKSILFRTSPEESVERIIGILGNIREGGIKKIEIGLIETDGWQLVNFNPDITIKVFLPRMAVQNEALDSAPLGELAPGEIPLTTGPSDPIIFTHEVKGMRINSEWIEYEKIENHLRTLFKNRTNKLIYIITNGKLKFAHYFSFLQLFKRAGIENYCLVLDTLPEERP